MSVESPDYGDLTENHPIKKFCDDWHIEDSDQRDALVELVVRCVIVATKNLVEKHERDLTGDISWAGKREMPEAC